MTKIVSYSVKCLSISVFVAALTFMQALPNSSYARATGTAATADAFGYEPPCTDFKGKADCPIPAQNGGGNGDVGGSMSCQSTSGPIKKLCCEKDGEGKKWGASPVGENDPCPTGKKTLVEGPVMQRSIMESF